ERERETPYHAAFHSVQNPPGKPWKSPDQAAPPRVYRVDPRGFRQLVQRLTGRPPTLASVSPSLTQLVVDGGADGSACGNQLPVGLLELSSSLSLHARLGPFPLLSSESAAGNME
ncbi:unnamed protein product, partial [Musa textilis]